MNKHKEICERCEIYEPLSIPCAPSNTCAGEFVKLNIDERILATYPRYMMKRFKRPASCPFFLEHELIDGDNR